MKSFRCLLASLFQRWSEELVEDEKTQKLPPQEPLPEPAPLPMPELGPTTKKIQWPVNTAPRNEVLEKTFPYNRLHPSQQHAQVDPVTPPPLMNPTVKRPTGSILRQYRHNLKQKKGLESGPLTREHQQQHGLRPASYSSPSSEYVQFSKKMPVTIMPSDQQTADDERWLLS